MSRVVGRRAGKRVQAGDDRLPEPVDAMAAAEAKSGTKGPAFVAASKSANVQQEEEPASGQANADEIQIDEDDL